MMTERHGVEIDYCPKCRGVWLDRGELDKIIERASDAAPSRPVAQTTSVTPTRNERDTPSGSYGTSRDAYRGDDDDYEYDSRTGKKKKKRGSFLEDLFDF
jgi:Zn-finger nucleic acid-binding protein